MKQKQSSEKPSNKPEPKDGSMTGFTPRSEAEAKAPDWVKQILQGMRTADPNNLPETP